INSGMFSKLRKLDVLLAGTPCQGFSTAGKRNVDDPRNSLLLIAGKIAGIVKPKVFLAENVSGVNAGSHKKYWEGLREILWNAGYQTADILCEGTKMGVAQIRKRRVLLAWNTGKSSVEPLFENAGGILSSVLRKIDRRISGHNIRKLPENSQLFRVASHIK